MHSRIRSNQGLERKRLEGLPTGSLASLHVVEMESTQPSETHILQVPTAVRDGTRRSLSPGGSGRRKARVHWSKSFAVEHEWEEEEHNVWEEEVPQEVESTNPLISFLQLYKFRHERYGKRAVSCFEVIQMVAK